MKYMTLLRRPESSAGYTFCLQVSLICEPLSLDQQNEGDLIVEGLFIQSAGWDEETGTLVESEQYVSTMPSVCVRAVTEQEMTVKWAPEGDTGEENGDASKDAREPPEKDSYNFYNCPIFTTKVNY